jgi:pheromone shutdown protein TraB
MSSDGRRAWAFAAICGGCIVFTVFAAVGVWLVSGHVLYTLILALAAHLQILVGMTALGWALGRRVQVDVTKDGAKINDGGGTP